MSLRPLLGDVSKGHDRPRSPPRPWWLRDHAGARHGRRPCLATSAPGLSVRDGRRMGKTSAGRTTGRHGVPQASGGQESSSGPAGARSRPVRRWLICGWGGAPATGNQAYLMRIWSTVDRRFPIPFGGWGVPGGRTGARSPLRDAPIPTPLAEEETVPEPDPADGWVHHSLGGPEVGQVVLPAMPRGSPAAPRRQVNVRLTRNNDLPYGFSCPPILSRTPIPHFSRPRFHRNWASPWTWM